MALIQKALCAAPDCVRAVAHRCLLAEKVKFLKFRIKIPPCHGFPSNSTQ